MIDDLAPVVMFSNKEVKSLTPQYIKNKLNERKRLIRINRINTSCTRTERIKVLNKDIKNYYHQKSLLIIICKYLSLLNTNTWYQLIVSSLQLGYVLIDRTPPYITGLEAQKTMVSINK